MEPHIATAAPGALVAAYKLALKNSKPASVSDKLTKERQLAVQDPQAERSMSYKPTLTTAR